MKKVKVLTESDLNWLPLQAQVALAYRCARRVEPVWRPYWLAKGRPRMSKVELARAEKNTNEARTRLFGLIAASAEGKADLDFADRLSVQSAHAGDLASVLAYGVLESAWSAARSCAQIRRLLAKRILDSSEFMAHHDFCDAVPFEVARAVAGSWACWALAEHLGLCDVDVPNWAQKVLPAAFRDFERLRELNLGEHQSLGQPLDPTESGPLGPLDGEGRPREQVCPAAN